MIAGLPWGAWLLMLAATVPGLVMGFAAYRAHGRPSDQPPTTPARDPGDARS